MTEDEFHEQAATEAGSDDVVEELESLPGIDDDLADRLAAQAEAEAEAGKSVRVSPEVLRVEWVWAVADGEGEPVLFEAEEAAGGFAETLRRRSVVESGESEAVTVRMVRLFGSAAEAAHLIPGGGEPDVQ